MKYELTTDPDGAMSIQSVTQFAPPLGLVLPAKQDVRAAAPSGKTLGTLITSAHPAIPEGMEIHTTSDLYVFVEGHWLNQFDETNADAVEISGLITLRNNSTYDVGITW